MFELAFTKSKTTTTIKNKQIKIIQVSVQLSILAASQNKVGKASFLCFLSASIPYNTFLGDIGDSKNQYFYHFVQQSKSFIPSASSPTYLNNGPEINNVPPIYTEPNLERLEQLQKELLLNNEQIKPSEKKQR
jgi:hypothetical protein